MTVGELEERMSDYELSCWVALYSVENAEAEHARKVNRSKGRKR